VFELLNEIALKVEKKIKNLPNKDEIICKNAYNDVTRKIDYISEIEALTVLENYPYNVLSEEKGYIDKGAEKTVILDPIDGSLNASLNLPIYSISIAIGTKMLSDIEYGFVKNIPTGETYYAERYKGVYLNGRKLEKKFPRDIFSVCLSSGASKNILEFVKKVKKVRAFGCASLELCFVATGSLKCYVQLIPLRIVDIAAGTLILRELGGEIYDKKFQVLDMPITINMKKAFIAVSDIKYKDEIWNYFKE